MSVEEGILVHEAICEASDSRLLRVSCVPPVGQHGTLALNSLRREVGDGPVQSSGWSCQALRYEVLNCQAITSADKFF